MSLSPDPAAACLPLGALLRTTARCSNKPSRGLRHQQAVRCWQRDPAEPWSRLSSRTRHQGVRWRLLAQIRDVSLSTIQTLRPHLKVTPMKPAQVIRDTWSGLVANQMTQATGRLRQEVGQCLLKEEEEQEETYLMPVKFL